jgi:lipopolysaccharide transport protein LptA
MRFWKIALICSLCLPAWGAAPSAPTTPAVQQQIHIAATGWVEIDDEKKIATAQGDVVLTTADGTVSADKMNLTYEGNLRTVASLTATGHVVIKAKATTKQSEERRIDAKSDSATFAQKDRILTLSGHVTGQIVVPARKQTIDLASQTAQIWLDENRVRLEGEGTTVTFTQPEKVPQAAPAKPNP